MSSPGVPWQARDSHRGQISQIHQWLRPIFKWRSPSAISKIFVRESKDGCRQQQGSLMHSQRVASPLRRSQYLIWMQEAFNPVLLATQFHIHYILLSYFVFHFTFPTLSPPPYPINSSCIPCHIRLSSYISFHCKHSLCLVFLSKMSVVEAGWMLNASLKAILYIFWNVLCSNSCSHSYPSPCFSAFVGALLSFFAH